MKVILFDMDGTLWNTADITYKVANEVGRNYIECIHIPKEAIDMSMGCGKEDSSRNYMPYLTKERREEIATVMMEKVTKELNKYGGTVYPGVIDTIKELSKNYKLGIVTNNTSDYAKCFARTTDTNEYFEYLYGAASYEGITKGELLKKIINDNNLEDVIYVGDTPIDKEATVVANIPFIFAKYGFGDVEEYDYAIEEFKDLLNIFTK